MTDVPNDASEAALRELRERLADPQGVTPLDVPAAVLRQRIRVALSVLGHRNDEQGELLTGLLRGEVEL